jgi:hypothetical protein
VGIRVTPQEVEFQETLIAEREAEIREIETGIHELNDIFRDLGTIVEQQGGLVGELDTHGPLVGTTRPFRSSCIFVPLEPSTVHV